MKEGLTNTDLLRMISSNGLEFVLTSQVDSSEILDEQTQELWLFAEEAVVTLLKHLDINSATESDQDILDTDLEG